MNPDPLLEKLNTLIDFFLGEQPIDGIWFGEDPPDRRKYWWRQDLREARQQLADIMNHRTVNRLEIIDHTDSGTGRDYVKWVDQPFEVELSDQDDGRTLKIFLKAQTEKP